MRLPFHPSVLLSMITAAATLGGCTPGEAPATQEEHGAAAAEFERGPHRGRLLRDGNFALELQIFEEGVPPEFHVHLFRDGKPTSPDAAEVAVSLKRLAGEVDRFSFSRAGDFLKGSGVVHEPHSFIVEVTAAESGRQHRWTYDSFEGRTTIPTSTAEAAGVRVESAGPATLAEKLVLTGRLVPNAERTRAVAARFPGAIRAVDKSVGDLVRAGERLASIESNESLEVYAVTAPIGGLVVERHANPGENAGSEPLYVIADYDALWAELTLFPRDLARVKTGQTVTLRSVDNNAEGTGTVTRIVPGAGSGNGQTSGFYTARVAMDNRSRLWTPGLFVEGSVQTGQAPVSLAVKRSALQSFRDFTVVFEQVGDTYEVRMLELGRTDDTWAEILGGLKPGARYVVENSYLIKADIEKSGASHDH